MAWFWLFIAIALAGEIDNMTPWHGILDFFVVWLGPVILCAAIASVISGTIDSIDARRLKVAEEQRLHAEEEKKQQRIRAEEERNRKEFEANQMALHKRLQEYSNDSSTILKNLSSEIKLADRALDEAEKEFSEGVFVPFWEAIEKAAIHLARFNQGVEQICDNAANYRHQKRKLYSDPPPFQVNVGILPVPIHTAERLRRVVRLAQKDPYFAMIYEQRKTSQLLVKGFTSLGQALNDMNHRITTSIMGLANSIDDLAASNSENSRELIASVEFLREQVQSADEARRAHEQTERKRQDKRDERDERDSRQEEERSAHLRSIRDMLDNIQRGK